MIHLHQFPKLLSKSYSYSPFCVKLELYLKVMNFSYDNSFSLELNKSPTGKMPFIETQGKKLADSNFIISYLEKESGESLDNHLSTEQLAISQAFIRLCEDSLYWTAVYSRWVDVDNKSWKKDFIESTGLPKLMSGLVYSAAKKNISRQLKTLGLLSLSSTEIYSKAEADLQAIASFLDGRGYFFNDKISLVDITVYSFLIQLKDGNCSEKMASFFEKMNFNKFLDTIQKFSNFER